MITNTDMFFYHKKDSKQNYVYPLALSMDNYRIYPDTCITQFLEIIIKKHSSVVTEVVDSNCANTEH